MPLSKMYRHHSIFSLLITQHFNADIRALFFENRLAVSCKTLHVLSTFEAILSLDAFTSKSIGSPQGYLVTLLTVIIQGITFEKARRATNRSLKMRILSLGSYLCYEEKISARRRHYNTIRQGAPFYHYLSGRRHFNTTTRSI